MIKVQNLSKTYRVAKRASGLGNAFRALFKPEYEKIEALKSISFEIGQGEIVGYIGPNGAGKSTTIKVMSGILVPDGGSCEILGRTPWKERVAHVREIGVVFGQRSQLLWDVPVIDSFELIRDIYKVPLNLFRESLLELVEVLKIGDLLDSPARGLSLGQRMRCELAASLLHGPRILFLDEPTIGLDAVAKLAVRDFIRKINKEKGVTVILTTHDVHDIEALAERVILIGKGSILYDGSFESMRARHADELPLEEFVAKLYGEMGIA
jgi:ABC-2 type transport system ATP-binding protein